MAFAFALLMEQMVKAHHIMNMHNRHAQIIGNRLFGFLGDAALFFLNKMQNRQKRGAFVLIAAGDLPKLF